MDTILKTTRNEKNKKVHMYREISAKVAHQILVVLPLLAHFAGETCTPWQSLPYAVIYDPAMHASGYFPSREHHIYPRSKSSTIHCVVHTCGATPPWRRRRPGCAWGGSPRGTPPGWPSPSSAPPPSPPSAAASSLARSISPSVRFSP